MNKGTKVQRKDGIYKDLVGKVQQVAQEEIGVDLKGKKEKFYHIGVKYPKIKHLVWCHIKELNEVT